MIATAKCPSHISSILAAALVACTLLGSLTTSASADPVPVGEIKMDALRTRFNVAGGGVAGEFVVNASRLNFTPVGLARRGANSDQFISFCVETTETIQLNKWYDADLNTETRNTNRPLQAETAYLYSQFIKGTLSEYRYFDSDASDGGKAASARALQEMIWYYQDPAGFAARYGTDAFDAGGYFMGTSAYKALARNWYAEIPQGIAQGGNDLTNVRIINIWEDGSGRQDTLAMIPLPAALWLGGVGLSIAGVVVVRSPRRLALAVA